MCGRLAMPEDGLVLCNQHKRKPKQQASSLQLSVSGLPTPLVTTNEPSEVSLDLTGMQYFDICCGSLYTLSCMKAAVLHCTIVQSYAILKRAGVLSLQSDH